MTQNKKFTVVELVEGEGNKFAVMAEGKIVSTFPSKTAAEKYARARNRSAAAGSR